MDHRATFITNPTAEALNEHLALWSDVGWVLVSTNALHVWVAGTVEQRPFYTLFWRKD